ncbi:MAG: cbb3-type cytochrome c oxidase subunit I [Solirubrobacterales bacterium]
MEAHAATPPGSIAHPDGERLTPPPDREAKLVGWLCAGTGLALFAVMGLLGLTMRLTQAEAIGVSDEWFYRIMTLHGSGMLAGTLLALMGGIWFVLKSVAPLNFSRMLVSYAAMVLGAVVVLVSVVFGGFGAGWTFLSPLPFLAASAWGTWAAAGYFVGLVLVGVGFFVFCIDVLASVTRAYGGFLGALGVRFLRGHDDDPPPPQVLAATAITTQGMLASAVGTTILIALIGKSIDSGVELDALWAKNLTYFFGHSYANLIIYLGAGMIYVLLPRYAGRPWKTTRPLAYGWLATLLLVTTAYGHHLYMDFVQPGSAQVIATISSSAAALPVAVVTIYTGVMLVWGSRYRWTLASTLIYLGFAGWTIGGVGAVIDSLIPINFRFHNTLWVPGHFHTYLMLGAIFWVMAFIVHMLERAAGRPASKQIARLSVGAMVLGGYGLVGAWYLSGALGVPRRYSVQPVGTETYSAVASAFVIVFAIGFLLLLFEVVRLALAARGGGGPLAAASPPPIAGGEPAAEPQPALTTPLQIGTVVAIAVAASFALLPGISASTEGSVQMHHLAHATQYLYGAALGVALGSTPSIFRRLAPRWTGVGIAAVIAGSAAMLLAMVPAIYEPLQDDSFLHGTYHIGIVALGVITGFGAALLGPTTGRLLVVLSVGMGLMYAAGVTGG